MALSVSSLCRKPGKDSATRPQLMCCLCTYCERSRGGDFAVRAFAEGEREALNRLLKPVASVLPLLVAKTKPRRKAA